MFFSEVCRTALMASLLVGWGLLAVLNRQHRGLRLLGRTMGWEVCRSREGDVSRCRSVSGLEAKIAKDKSVRKVGIPVQGGGLMLARRRAARHAEWDGFVAGSRCAFFGKEKRW